MINFNITKQQVNEDVANIYSHVLEPYKLKKYNSYVEAYEHAKMQLFTNENTKYINSMNINGKTLLAVAGGFDSIFDFILKGTNSVVAVDINRKQYYVGQLKMWAIQKLPYNTYKELLIDGHKLMGSLSILLKNVNPKDDSAASIFWQKTLKKLGFILTDNVFTGNLDETFERRVLCNYLENEKSYLELREKLNNTKIEFIAGNMLNIINSSDFANKFDNVLLSNISDYIDVEKFNNFVNNDVKKVLSPSGKVLAQYIINATPKQLDAKFGEDRWLYCQGLNKVQQLLGYKQLSAYNSFLQNKPETITMTSGNGRVFLSEKDTAVIIKKENLIEQQHTQQL